MRRTSNSEVSKENRSNTSPIGKSRKRRENSDRFKNSSVLKNATENLFLNTNLKQNKVLFSNTFNFPESVVNLHQSINKDQSQNNSNVDKLTSSSFRNKNNQETSGTNFRDFEFNSNRMYPSLVTPTLKKLSETDSTLYTNKQVINLEDLYIGEEKLWAILEAMRSGQSLNFACEDYFDFIHMTSIHNLENYFLQNETKLLLNTKDNLEIISGMCIVVTILKNCLNEKILNHLKNLFFYVHQNFLVLVNFVISRLPKEFEFNVWAIKLKSIIKMKSVNSDNSLVSMKQNNVLILNSVTKYISINFKTKNEAHIYEVLTDILANIDRLAFSTKNSLSNHQLANQSNVNFPVIPAPYLPALPEDQKNTAYTLVLDLDETLVHYVTNSAGGELLIRPGAQNFLIEMSKYYEIVVFTAALQDYADWILDSLDVENKLIKYRLYRYHASINKNTYVKDISKLGRDLNRTIIIDNVWENFQLQQDNGIFIKTWLEDKNDTCLTDLIPLLKEFVIQKVPDVRKSLRKIRDLMIRLFLKGDQNPYETLKKSLITGNNE